MGDGRSTPPSQCITLSDVFETKPELLTHSTGTVPVLTDEEDTLAWRWSSHGNYTAASVYNIMITAGKEKWGCFEVWRSLAPAKVKILTYLVLNNRVLTHDVMLTRGMNCDARCAMCDNCSMETVHHLFFQCSYAQAVWHRMENLMQTADTILETWELSRTRYSAALGIPQRQWATRCMAIIWLLWKQRNEVILRGKRRPPGVLSNMAGEEARLWITVGMGQRPHSMANDTMLRGVMPTRIG